MAGKKKCAGEAYDRYSGRFYSCTNAGKHHEDGKWWCGIHAPSKKAAKQKKQWDAYRAEQRRKAAQMKVASARDTIASVAIGLQEAGTLDNDALLVAIWNCKAAQKELEDME